MPPEESSIRSNTGTQTQTETASKTPTTPTTTVASSLKQDFEKRHPKLAPQANMPGNSAQHGEGQSASGPAAGIVRTYEGQTAGDYSWQTNGDINRPAGTTPTSVSHSKGTAGGYSTQFNGDTWGVNDTISKRLGQQNGNSDGKK
ncbi:uncharacterized protein BKCO1_4700051 [Diplodia corticola]|uniref:Uncharacterized protein n=1 Tax=Diplodia corticola TaxID=236234 RepID=A0A1J9QRI7_9PEZI|nr:uncharacterized protein BKCO1_4700051 [Diplodia corticola]OJD31558.1 hypothetical protein BKCO1_4700051 [Diplodia corticola]